MNYIMKQIVWSGKRKLNLINLRHQNLFCVKYSSSISSTGEDNSTDLNPQSLPLPEFKNVVNYLYNSLSRYESLQPKQAKVKTLLKQLGANKSLSDSLDLHLKNQMNIYPNWLSEQSKLRKLKQTLKCREPLPIRSNPAFVFPSISQKSFSNNFLIEYISAMILAIIDYRSKLIKENLDESIRMFGSSRIPGNEIDSHHFTELSNEFTVVFSRQFNFFQIRLNTNMQEGEMFFILKKCVEFILSYKNFSNVSFGSLSTLPRTDFALGCQFLNGNGLQKLRESQFLVNLDHVDENMSEDDLKKHIFASNQDNVGNRWFDKSIQLIIVLGSDSSDKMNHLLASGICYENSLVEMSSVLKLAKHGIDYLSKFNVILIYTYQTQIN